MNCLLSSIWLGDLLSLMRGAIPLVIQSTNSMMILAARTAKQCSWRFAPDLALHYFYFQSLKNTSDLTTFDMPAIEFFSTNGHPERVDFRHALLVGQAVPREWLRPGQSCGIERTATYFGPASVVFTGGENEITARLDAPRRNPPAEISLRFREPGGRPLSSVEVNGKPWRKFKGDWVQLPGDIGTAAVVARYAGK